MLERLREKKVKATPQRLAVLEYLRSGYIHPSAEEIYKKLKPLCPSLSLATVYNTLEALVDAGAVNRLTIDARRTNYEYGRAPHAHFLCRVCGEIYDMPIRRAGAAVLRGHKIEKTWQYHQGVCRKCLKSPQKKI
ncbi:MAG: transcriptional repressor [Candidatus Margulisbacteria bacterium]|nr:transcriptional repressor [Candidatus Margulisiibacteriota bacterium]